MLTNPRIRVRRLLHLCTLNKALLRLYTLPTGLRGVAMDAVRRLSEAVRRLSEERPGRDAQGVPQEGDAYLVDARLKHRKQAQVQRARRTPKLQSNW